MSDRSQRVTRTPGPRWVAGKRRAAVEPAYFEDTGISLKDRGQVALTARFSYRPDAAVEFRLRIEYVIGGKSKQMMIDNSGSPFRVSSWHCSDRQGAAVLDYKSAYTNQEGEPGELIFAAQRDPHHLYGFACA